MDEKIISQSGRKNEPVDCGEMKEIVLGNNYIGKRILMNGIPDLSEIPEETLSCFAEVLFEKIKSADIAFNYFL